MLPPSVFRLKSSLSRSLRLISTRSRRLLSSACSAPWLTLPPTLEGDDMVHNFYSLADDKVLSFNRRSKAKEPKPYIRKELPDVDSAIVGSSHGWLALHSEHKGHMFLYNPISGRILSLPPVTNLLDPDDFRLGLRIPKFILSCSPDDGECHAMISFGRGDRLAFCLPGVSVEWTPIGISDAHVSMRYDWRYQDFVYSPTDKLFTCVNEINIIVWDLREPWAPRMEPPKWMPGWNRGGTKLLDPSLKIGFDKENYPWPDRSEEETELKCSCRQLKYLISLSDGRLFLVIRYIVEQMAPDGSPYFEPDPVDIIDEVEVEVHYPYKTIGFDVHRVDRGDEKWRLSYMEGCLDGMAMFVGSNQSFALSAAEFPQLKPDAIYFTDDKDLSLYNPPAGCFTSASYGGHDVGIFDYENRTISSCYYPSDYHSIKRIVPPPLWFTPTNKPK